MRSTLGDETPVHARRVWEAPAITELPIGTETRSAGGTGIRPPAANGPPAPAPPAFETRLFLRDVVSAVRPDRIGSRLTFRARRLRPMRALQPV